MTNATFSNLLPKELDNKAAKAIVKSYESHAPKLSSQSYDFVIQQLQSDGMVKAGKEYVKSVNEHREATAESSKEFGKTNGPGIISSNSLLFWDVLIYKSHESLLNTAFPASNDPRLKNYIPTRDKVEASENEIRKMLRNGLKNRNDLPDPVKDAMVNESQKALLEIFQGGDASDFVPRAKEYQDPFKQPQPSLINQSISLPRDMKDLVAKLESTPVERQGHGLPKNTTAPYGGIV